MRSKTCAEDDRVSSLAIGTIFGAGLLSLLGVAILFSDIIGVIVFSYEQIADLCKRIDVNKTVAKKY
jgi:hypothetical protein